ncbi:MAG: hypothetical protein QXQ40_01975 [Candidatus Aenigmatarchaeota archaeon]
MKRFFKDLFGYYEIIETLKVYQELEKNKVAFNPIVQTTPIKDQKDIGLVDEALKIRHG